MKKILYSIVLIFLPVIVAFMLIPVEKRSRYAGLKDDCFNHAIWIHDRLYMNEKSVDIAFIGSSHTVNGINDKLIENSLKTENTSVANFGYCRLGRNLSYTLIKEIYKKKKPKVIVIEVLEDEDRYSHPIFPYIAETRDIFAPALLFNRDIATDIREAILFKLTLIQQFLFPAGEKIPVNNEAFGFACSPDTAAIETLQEIKIKRHRSDPEMPAMERNFYMNFPRSYLKKIAEMCKIQNTKLIFLYLPGYGAQAVVPKENATYMRYGEVLIPPDSITANISYWKDEDHVNQAGAASLSRWIAEELNVKLKPK